MEEQRGHQSFRGMAVVRGFSASPAPVGRVGRAAGAALVRYREGGGIDEGGGRNWLQAVSGGGSTGWALGRRAAPWQRGALQNQGPEEPAAS